MRKITKKESGDFIKKMQNELIGINAVPFISDNLQFDLETKYGVLWLRIDKNNQNCYTVYSRFIDTTKIKDLDFCNNFSGKYNHHLSGNFDWVVRSIILDFKNLLN